MANRALLERSSVGPDDRLIAALHSRDWDFHDSTTENDAHNIHPFPAKFIAQIPRTILSLFRVAPGTAVLDPFCGSGTTLLEAKNAGVDFVGVDLNPIAVLISKVKTDGLQPDALLNLHSVAQTARSHFVSGEYLIPEIPRLNHWFRPEIAAAMACISDAIRTAECTDEVRSFLRLSLSAITVRVSNQESETRYAAINKPIQAMDVFRIFEKTGENIATKLQKSSLDLFSPRRGSGRILNLDARDIGNVDVPPISLVITSPPYPNAFEYWLYNKYRMYWLGYDPIGVRKVEIGARPHYVSSKGDTIHDFSEQMAAVFGSLSKHLVQGAPIAVVVSSDCRIRGEVFDVPVLLEEALTRTGYEPLTQVRRRIPRTRKAFNPEIGSIESETLLFMRWPGAS
jgi:SAM-dependent methyltransferase